MGKELNLDELNLEPKEKTNLDNHDPNKLSQTVKGWLLDNLSHRDLSYFIFVEDGHGKKTHNILSTLGLVNGSRGFFKGKEIESAILKLKEDNDPNNEKRDYRKIIKLLELYNENSENRKINPNDHYEFKVAEKTINDVLKDASNINFNENDEYDGIIVQQISATDVMSENRNTDGKDVIYFSEDDYLILLKHKSGPKWDFFRIKKEDGEKLDELLGNFYHDDILKNKSTEVPRNTSLDSDEFDDYYSNSDGYDYNKIYFGAPGTGKSHKLNKDKDSLLLIDKQNYERVTFHPDYSYANFVGTYKPVPKKDEEGNDNISYEYVPGPFMRVLVDAILNPSKPFLLIIEEINRANIAAVFGDIFQLLDRNNEGCSEYPIHPSEDMKNYLKTIFDKNNKSYDKHFPNDEIRIPSNMFIWSTMNSADQGVFMMDTAFKRRWNFEYIDIDDNSNLIEPVTVKLGKDKKPIHWNALRKAINNELLSYGINEDKLLGPFFINLDFEELDELNNGDNSSKNMEINEEKFINIFKNKIIMYLFEDVAKARRNTLFSGVESKGKHLLYSDICKEFSENGIEIFSEDLKIIIIKL